MIIDIVCTFSATTIQAETKSVSLVLTFPATQLPSNICEEVRDCLGISPSGEADYFLNEQGDWVQVQGGGGAVDSVNGQTGVVILDADDIAETATRFWLTSALKTAYDSAVTWISTNGTNLINHLSNTNNPHNTTAAQVGAPSGSGTSTGTNTGDQDLSGLVPYTGATQNVDLGTYNLIADQVALNVTPNGTLAVGMTEWNNTVGVSQTLLKGGSVTLKNGVDLVARVVNKVSPNTTLTKAAYQVVKISGAQGQRLAVDLAQANNDNNSADTLGVVTETIAANQEGFIMTVGQLEGINTTGSLQSETWTDGDVLYLSPTVAGRITNVKPTGATGHIVIIGYVEYAHANNGKIYVKIMNGWELDELHNVYINTGTLANNDALIYESSTQLWKNKTIATALGFTPENVANKQSAVTTNANHYYNAPYINSIIKPNDIIICDTTNAAFTNQSANFILKSYLIAANTFAVGDVLRWFWSQQKTTTSNTIIHRLYINNSASLVGAVEIFRYDAAAAARDYTMARFQPHFSDATTLKSPSVTSGVVGITDIISINSLSTRSDTWDIATQKYLILAINPLALGDVFTFQSFTLERIRI
jgi:nitrogen fixation protein